MYESYEEDLLQDIQDYFKNNLGKYLSGVSTKKGDGIKLPDIKKYEIGDKDIFSFTAYPAMLINPDEAPYEPLSLGSDNLNMRVLFTIVITGGKTENLTKKILRYVAAVRQCINADRTAGGKIDRIRPANVVYYSRPVGIEDKMVVDFFAEVEKCIPI